MDEFAIYSAISQCYNPGIFIIHITMNDQVNSPEDIPRELKIPDWMWKIQFPQSWDDQILCAEDGLPYTPICEPDDLSETEDTDREA